jgi:hypothetical protein
MVEGCGRNSKSLEKAREVIMEKVTMNGNVA